MGTYHIINQTEKLMLKENSRSTEEYKITFIQYLQKNSFSTFPYIKSGFFSQIYSSLLP